MNNTSTDFNVTKCGTGIFLAYPLTWEITKWIRVVELLLTVVLNTAVIILLVRIRKRSNLVFFVINLAISDLSVGLVHVFPLAIVHFSTNWTLGLALCKLNFYLSNVSLYASTYLIVIIRIDRLHSVFRPLSTVRQLTRYRLLMVLSPWMFALTLCIPVLYWTILYPACGSVICTPNLIRTGMTKTIILLNSIILLFIPTIMIFCCYGFIVFLLRQRLELEKQAPLGKRDLPRSSAQSKTFSNANRRSIILTFVDGVTFIICWMPYNLINLLNTFRVIGHGGGFDILNALAPLNSVLNPIIFLAFNHRMFKKTVTQVFANNVNSNLKFYLVSCRQYVDRHSDERTRVE